MALEHHLSLSSHDIPELDTSILRAAKYPMTIWSKANAKNKVLIIAS